MKEYDTIVLAELIPEVEIPLGTKGVVLMVFSAPYRAYEVEFVDSSGNSLGTYTVTDDQVSIWDE